MENPPADWPHAHPANGGHHRHEYPQPETTPGPLRTRCVPLPEARLPAARGRHPVTGLHNRAGSTRHQASTPQLQLCRSPRSAQLPVSPSLTALPSNWADPGRLASASRPRSVTHCGLRPYL